MTSPPPGDCPGRQSGAVGAWRLSDPDLSAPLDSRATFGYSTRRMGTPRRPSVFTREDVDSLVAKGREWNFHDEDSTAHLHSLHPFPAKFIPQIPRRAIGLWTKPGDSVYDPFAGSGTSLLEASLSGRASIGTDNNAIAVLVSSAKCHLYSRKDLRDLEKFGGRLSRDLRKAPARPDLVPGDKNFVSWFSPAILDRLSALRGLILSEPDPVRTLLLALLSSIVVRVSYQDSDTRYVRKVRPMDAGLVESAFMRNLASAQRKLPEVMVPGRAPSRVVQADARRIPFVESGSVSLVVTSPPYLNAYDYHKYHRQRLHLISGDIPFARNLEIGSHDAFTRANANPDAFFVDMDLCFGEWARVLKPGGRCLVVVGDAIVAKQPVMVADRLVDLLKARGLAEERRWIRTLHSHRRTFRANSRRIAHEHVLLMRKQ